MDQIEARATISASLRPDTDEGNQELSGPGRSSRKGGGVLRIWAAGMRYLGAGGPRASHTPRSTLVARWPFSRGFPDSPLAGFLTTN